MQRKQPSYPGIVLDAGALIALESRGLVITTALQVALRRRVPVRVSTGALAQVWRGGAGRGWELARILKQDVTIEPLLESTAKSWGC